ncbi:MAG: hypothetical protein EOO46_23230 [Flavobacterium sp.]|nr:MAG: hypothetical protein EOO46_23230 [Flavobacterium sp.]
MKNLLMLLFIFLICCDKKQEQFNSEKWKNACADSFCNDRELMVQDLLKSRLIVGMLEDKIISLLGKPNNVDSVGIRYDVFIDYGWNIDPIETKTLEFKIKNHRAIDFSLEHWKAE